MTAGPHAGHAYFQRRDAVRFDPTSAVQGAWDVEEQHIAPALGLLTHVLELEHRQRHAQPLAISRVSFDILGTLPIDTVEVATRIIRPGRTIELAEATLSHGGRAALIARAWFSQNTDTAAIAGTTFPSIPPVEAMPPWDGSKVWPGGFVASVDGRRDEVEPGRARFWMRPKPLLLAGEEVSATARLLGIVDIANGSTPRVAPEDAHFPNLDLTAHLFRAPTDGWFGFDTTVTFGPSGHGMTHSILHDERGPLGAVVQSLTVRPRR